MSAPNRSNPEKRPMLVNPLIWEDIKHYQGNPRISSDFEPHPERCVSSLAIRMCFRTPRNTRLEPPELTNNNNFMFRKNSLVWKRWLVMTCPVPHTIKTKNTRNTWFVDDRVFEPTLGERTYTAFRPRASSRMLWARGLWSNRNIPCVSKEFLSRLRWTKPTNYSIRKLM